MTLRSEENEYMQVPFVSASEVAAAKHARELLALAAADIRFVNAAITTTLSVNPGGFYVYIDILERDTGAPTTFQARWDIPTTLLSREHATDWIYACVREAWIHELNEAMLVNGVRRRDLHEGEDKSKRPPEEIEAVQIEIEHIKTQIVGFLETVSAKLAMSIRV
jgi:hypothetical protein